jgi:solute carrier family 25 S-adenosylmethionine transporter 26
METETSNRDVALCAAAASAITKSTLHPIDTVKCRLQAAEYNGVAGFVRHYEGKWTPRHLYRGLGVKILMYMPFQSIYMTTYSASKRNLSDRQLPLWFVVGTASVIADVTAAVVRVPMEAAKMRLQSSVYKHSLHAVKDLRAGGIRPLFRLVIPQIFIHDLPYGFVMWICYEYLTPIIGSLIKSRTESRPVTSLVSGAISGSVAGALTVPLDVIKTRTVVMSVDREANVTVSSVVRTIYAVNGWRGFTRGLSARVLWISANVGMYFATFEALKTFRKA